MGEKLKPVTVRFTVRVYDAIQEIASEYGKSMAYKRANDPTYREGRKPAYSKAQLDHAIDLLREHSFTDVSHMTGISRSTVTREARKRGFKKSASICTNKG